MNGWRLRGLVSFVLALSFTVLSGLPAFERLAMASAVHLYNIRVGRV